MDIDRHEIFVACSLIGLLARTDAWYRSRGEIQQLLDHALDIADAFDEHFAAEDRNAENLGTVKTK